MDKAMDKTGTAFLSLSLDRKYFRFGLRQDMFIFQSEFKSHYWLRYILYEF